MAKAIIMHETGGPEVLRWEEYDPGKVDKHARNATIAKVKEWIAMFGSAGKA
jgi:hypothetical protein